MKLHSPEDLDFLRQHGFVDTAEEIERLHSVLKQIAAPIPSLGDQTDFAHRVDVARIALGQDWR